MQITALPVTLASPAQSPRADVVERIQKDVPRQTRGDEQAADRSLEELRQTNDDVLQQRIEARNQASKTNPRNSNETLPLNTQRALQAFADNTPTPEQQLGIELVGVDTFA